MWRLYSRRRNARGPSNGRVLFLTACGDSMQASAWGVLVRGRGPPFSRPRIANAAATPAEQARSQCRFDGSPR